MNESNPREVHAVKLGIWRRTSETKSKYKIIVQM